MRSVILILVLLWSSFAAAGPLPAPDLKRGQYVYSIPGGYVHPEIGELGYEKIQQGLARLKFPFYVVAVKEIAVGRQMEKGLTDAIDGLAADWQRNRNFDVETSTIFLIVEKPRKTVMLAGARWKTELGFVNNAHMKYTDMFKAAMRGTPKNPVGGVLKMAGAIDAYVFNETDPELKAAREAAAILDAENRRIAAIKHAKEQAALEVTRQRVVEERRILEEHRAAQAGLNLEIMRLTSLLSVDESFLPDNKKDHSDNLKRARDVYNADKPEKMIAEAKALKVSNDALETHVNSTRSSARWAAFTKAAIIFAILALIAAFLAFCVMQHRRLKSLRKQFAARIQGWQTRIADESARYVDYFTTGRDEIKRMLGGGLEGATRERVESVTAKVNWIFAAVESLARHIARHQILIDSAWIFNLKPALKAIDEVQEAFNQVIESTAKNGLFGLNEVAVTIDPIRIESELDNAVLAAKQMWDELEEAVAIRRKSAEDHFPHTTLDRLFTRCDENGVPRRWLRTHPLFGDDASDALFYKTLNALRLNDPLAFKVQLEKLQEDERVLEAVVDNIVAMLDELKAVRIISLEDLEAVFDASDNPAIKLVHAKQVEDRIRALLETSDDTLLIDSVIDEAWRGYATVGRLYEAAKVAIRRVDEHIAEAQQAHDLAYETYRLAVTTETQAVLLHSNTNCRDSLTAAWEENQHGKISLSEAITFHKERRVLNAIRKAEEAITDFERSKSNSTKAVQHCQGLDEQKARYLLELGEMPGHRVSTVDAIHRYEGDPALLPIFHEPSVQEPTNYGNLLAKLADQRRAWEDLVHSAKSVWELEQKRHRLYSEYQKEVEAAKHTRDVQQQQLQNFSSTLTLGFNAPNLSSNAPETQIEASRASVRNAVSQWDDLVRRAKYAYELEQKRLGLLRKYEGALRDASTAIGIARQSISRYGESISISINHPSIYSSSSIEQIESALHSLKRQQYEWNNAVNHAQRNYEAEQERLHQIELARQREIERRKEEARREARRQQDEEQRRQDEQRRRDDDARSNASVSESGNGGSSGSTNDY